MPIPKPQYTVWQAISAALALATRALNEVRALARIPGPQGEKGEKGEAGFGFTDMTYDGERRLTFKRFDDLKVFVMPILIDRGVWKVDQAYERGDCISYDGGLWSAQIDNQGERPGREKGWRLMVKQPRAKL
jgi:hypothetical protein